MINTKSANRTTTGVLHTGPARLVFIYGVPSSTAGSIVLRDSTDGSGEVKVTLQSVGSVRTVIEIPLADEGMRFVNGIHVTLTNVAGITVFFAG
tara:strand:+ start:25 stop:306 length:282 start_codon:yes stop_codon:yes gene_type:complete